MSAPAPKVDLRHDHWAIVRSALRRHVPDREVLVFGSRATGNAKEYSDLDLAIMGEEPLSLREVSALDEALGESDLPFKVDIVEWARIDEGFRGIIRGHGVVVRDVGGLDLVTGSVRESPPDPKSSGIAGKWPTLSLRAAGVTLFDCEHRTPPAQEFGYPYVGIPQVKDGRIDLASVRRISREHFDEWTRKSKPQPLDVVLSRRCNPGTTACVPNGLEFALGQNLVLLRSSGTRVFQPYLRWLVRGPQWWEQVGKYLNVGAVFDSLKCADIPRFQLSIPPLSDQRAIAHALGTLDDKIELNRRMNETLEAMARALFKSWFVDFDPVRAKMDGRDTGLPQDIADLFSDRLVDSEMGEMPEGWEAKSLKDSMNLTMGQSPPGSTYNDHGDGLPFFQGRSEFGFRYPQKRRFCSAPTRVADPEDTLVSVRAPVGDINLAWERCCIGRGVAALRHKSGSSSFTYHSAWALRRELEEYEHTGTVFGAINKGQFEALRVTEPDPCVVEAFDAMSASHDARIRSNVAESDTLAALRDTLLPKLISGAIRLGKTARTIGTTA